jgi:toxin HigB-1
VIRSIRHKGLKRLYEDDDPRGLKREHAIKLGDILARLDAASTATDMRLPGFDLHPLKGNLKGFWAITVRRTGGSFFVSRRATHSTLIMWTTIEGAPKPCR